MLYSIFNHETKKESVVTEQGLENLFPELRLGVIEVVDEIDLDLEDLTIDEQ